MSFEIAHQWTLRCDGTTTSATTRSAGSADQDRCQRQWTGWADTRQHDSGEHDGGQPNGGEHDGGAAVDLVPVVILFDAPELVAGDREALAADGWLVCRDGAVLCPACRQTHADTTWATLTSTSIHRGSGGAR